MKLEKIKNVLENYAKEHDLKLFEMNFSKSDSTLSILFDEKLNMEQLETISDEISVLLDQYDDEFEENYFLDVSTIGIERPIRNQQELIDAIGSYIYLKDKENEYYGDLLSYEDGLIKLSIKDKTRNKLVEIDYQNVKNVRYAVKF